MKTNAKIIRKEDTSTELLFLVGMKNANRRTNERRGGPTSTNVLFALGCPL